MTQTANFIAADLGASSGRIMLGRWDGRTFSVEQLHRFTNGGVRAGDGLYWDILGIWSQIRAGLAKYHVLCPQPPQGIAVDAWGVDFGLLDRAGRLIGNPRHYRDSRTAGIPQHVFKAVPERQWFSETGVQTMPINTLFQLYSMVRAQDPALTAAETLLMIPDLCTYFLCGEKTVEWTEAATTQMYSLQRKDWARTLLSALDLPVSILPAVTPPGSVLSLVRPDVIEDCGFTQSFPAIAVGSHDTASAVAAIPNMSEDSVFLSSGTWSLMGVEAAEPDTSEEALRLGFTNEGGADGSVLLLKNITGLWIVQECLRHWASEGRQYTWDELASAAEAAKAFRCFIDPDSPAFQAQCNMPRAIRQYCAASGQTAPETAGEIARCAFESLGLKYRSVLESLRKLTGRVLGTIRVVGGGGLNAVLCQMTADACGCQVVSGPSEASSLGNVMLQAVATGHLADVRSGRSTIAESVQCLSFDPHRSERWDEAYACFRVLEATEIDCAAGQHTLR
ncbi:MAG: FGGY-family carbohydrate kinase [Terracidiphilus sp.]|jgi:rhamnulokinase